MDKLGDRLLTSPLYSAGYGVVPKTVMQDKQLTITAKCIYSYFCSFAGAGDTCFPSRDKICYDLSISPHTFHKYLRELTERGYIITEQVKENGRFSHNLYTLSDSPCVNSPCAKVSHTDSFAHDNTAYDDTAYDNLLPKINNNKNEHTVLKLTEGEKPPARKKTIKRQYGEFRHVRLTDDEFKKLTDELGEQTVTEYIRRLDEYLEQTGKTYRNHSLTIRNWVGRDSERGKPKQPAQQPEKTNRELYRVDFSKYR